jgi:hypothetical protein
MYSQQYLDNLDSNQYDEFLFWSGQISKKGLDSTPNSDIMEPMNDNIEIQGDLRDEYLAIQEAETSDEPVMASDEEIKELLQEMWEEMLAPEPEEEYTEEDAYRDFHANTYEEFN